MNSCDTHTIEDFRISISPTALNVGPRSRPRLTRPWPSRRVCIGLEFIAETPDELCRSARHIRRSPWHGRERSVEQIDRRGFERAVRESCLARGIVESERAVQRELRWEDCPMAALPISDRPLEAEFVITLGA